MKCRWDSTAQEIRKIFFFRLLAHVKSRLARGKNYHLFSGKKKLIGVPRFAKLAMFSTEAQKQQTEYTGCAFTGEKNKKMCPILEMC